MHPALLVRFFDLDAWHREVFLALLEYQPTWTWQDLSDAFMQVCCHLNSPKHSASLTTVWITHMHRMGWCAIQNVQDDATKTIIEARTPALPQKKPRCRRAMLKAIRWSMDHREIENKFKAILDAGINQRDALPQDADGLIDFGKVNASEVNALCAKVERARKERDKALAAHRRKFRLAGPKK